MSEVAEPVRKDIEGRPDLIRLVDRFYTKVRKDEKLGPIFDDIAQVDWAEHLPKLYNFWDSVIFRAGNFRGNPLMAHAKLLGRADLSLPMFHRWLDLFKETINEMFSGERSEHIYRCAEDMANVIYSKIHQIPDPRFDVSKLTPEQRARYARYREGEEASES